MRQYWSGIVSPAYIADGTALANSTTITDINPVPNWQIPGQYLEANMVFHFEAFGKFSTTGTPTLNLGLYYGAVAGTALATTGAITTTSGVTNVTWRLSAWMRVRTIGATGTAIVWGHVSGISGTVGVSVVPLPASAPAAVTIDTTAAKFVTVGATWGTASASNTITCQDFIAIAEN